MKPGMSQHWECAMKAADEERSIETEINAARRHAALS
jgi:hypothetical protein